MNSLGRCCQAGGGEGALGWGAGGGGEDWPYSGCILKVELTRYADGLDEGSEGRESRQRWLLWSDPTNGWVCPDGSGWVGG